MYSMYTHVQGTSSGEFIKWLRAVLTNNTTNYQTNSAAPMKTYQLIRTSGSEHKLLMLQTEPSNLRENKHHYQQSHALTTQQCDCVSIRLLIVHTTIGQEVSTKCNWSSSEEQQHNKWEPTVNTLVVTVQDRTVFDFSVICALKIRTAVSIFVITHTTNSDGLDENTRQARSMSASPLSCYCAVTLPGTK